MQMVFEILLGKSRAEVWKAFDNPANLKKWQPTLVSFEPVSGTPGRAGAVSRLTYREGKRRVVLTETITLRREPDEFAGTYDSGMAVNAIHNSFVALDGARTNWIVTTDFRFAGLWILLLPVMRGAIRKRVRSDLGRFKEMLEAGQL